MLLLRNGHMVQIRELVDELWGEQPPASALSTLQTYVYKLRKMLADGEPSAELLRTKPSGYQIMVSSEDIDLFRFDRLADEGHALLDDDPARAGQVLTEALALWRGAALADVVTGDVLAAYVTRIEERRLSSLDLRLEADLRLGRHTLLVSELKSLALTYPMHEGFRAKLMLALYRSGRSSEALEAYQQMRRLLVDELGIEPSPMLVQMHQAVLSLDPALDLAPEPVTVSPAAGPAPAPAQLPPDISDFIGRADIIERIEKKWIRPERDNGTAVRVVVLTGMPGVGKTTAAVHLAHRIRPQFPGGQLYATLRDPDGQPVSPLTVLGNLLRAVGVPDADLPANIEERSKLFRTYCSERPPLLLLDDAMSTVQVLPLLPGAPRCAVIVTSRNAPYGMAGAQIISVPPLSIDEGIQLLSTSLGRHRVEREREAAAKLVELCGQLPLALRGAAARLAAAPGWPLARQVDQLVSARNRLDELRYADLDVQGRFDSSYERLNDWEKGVFRLLSLLPTVTFTVRQASGLLGVDLDSAETALMQLTANHFLRVHRDEQSGIAWYTFDELTRVYARLRLELELNLADHHQHDHRNPLLP